MNIKDAIFKVKSYLANTDGAIEEDYKIVDSINSASVEAHHFLKNVVDSFKKTERITLSADTTDVDLSPFLIDRTAVESLIRVRDLAEKKDLFIKSKNDPLLFEVDKSTLKGKVCFLKDGVTLSFPYAIEQDKDYVVTFIPEVYVFKKNDIVSLSQFYTPYLIDVILKGAVYHHSLKEGEGILSPLLKQMYADFKAGLELVYAKNINKKLW